MYRVHRIQINKAIIVHFFCVSTFSEVSVQGLCVLWSNIVKHMTRRLNIRAQYESSSIGTTHCYANNPLQMFNRAIVFSNKVNDIIMNNFPRLNHQFMLGFFNKVLMYSLLQCPNRMNKRCSFPYEAWQSQNVAYSSQITRRQ